jgi:hypothetical protein
MNTDMSCDNSDFLILTEELNKLIDKWRERLNHSNGEGQKDIHDCYLCSTIMYEIERAKQLAQNRIMERRNNAFKTKFNTLQNYTSDKTAIVNYSDK